MPKTRAQQNRAIRQDALREQLANKGLIQHVIEIAKKLAEPDIAEAFQRCVARGAARVAVSPFFLLPGRHWREDIPRLTEQAARKHPGIPWLVAAPIGLHPLMAEVIGSRLQDCLAHADDDRQRRAADSDGDLHDNGIRAERNHAVRGQL